MGMLMTMNGSGSGNSSCIQPSPQVLSSLPLLVYEYDDHPDATAPTAADPAPADSTATPDTTMTTKMLIYSLSERSIVYTHSNSRPQVMMDGNNTCFSTPQGWLLILGEVSEASLWHPLTGETIALPPIHDDHYIPIDCKCLLTHSSAAHPDCAVVLLDGLRPPHVVLPGQWRDWPKGPREYDISDYDLPEEFCTPTKKVIGDACCRNGQLVKKFAETKLFKFLKKGATSSTKPSANM